VSARGNSDPKNGAPDSTNRQFVSACGGTWLDTSTDGYSRYQLPRLRKNSMKPTNEIADEAKENERNDTYWKPRPFVICKPEEQRD
jgi:hypothetical protein